VRLVYFYANFLNEQGRAAEAVRQYEQLSAWLRRYPSLIPEVGADYFVWYGAALEARGDVEAALEQYRLAWDRRPEWAVPARNMGQVLMKQGRHREAVDVYRRALAADEAFWIGYVNLVVCLVQLELKEDARAVLETFKRVAVPTAEHAYYRGFMAQRLGDIEDAERSFRQALELDPGRDDARAALQRLPRTRGAGPTIITSGDGDR
jgi:tetratricopeptide (TPR) repeat protein